MGGNNLHRNVLFRGDANEANCLVPFSQFDSQNPEDLWKFLDKFRMDTGAEVLAIPYNGNLSNGRMFSVETFDGKPLIRQLAELRASLEPIIEATQIKGDGEAHPMLSPNDEFADYETWVRSKLNGTETRLPANVGYAKSVPMGGDGWRLTQSHGWKVSKLLSRGHEGPLERQP
jgi:hypothetical protein